MSTTVDIHAREDVVDAYPLAALQSAMLVNHLRAPRSGVDIVQMVCTLNEAVHVPELRAAWEVVTERHDALRTTFRWEGVPEPVQVVFASAPPEVKVIEWPDADDDEFHRRMRAFLAQDRTAGVDYRTPPLQRVTLIRHADNDWRMVWTFHHALIDGRSFALILREVMALYDGREQSASVERTAPRAFRDFANWYAAQDFGAAQPFWREYLRGFTAPTPLPAAAQNATTAAGGRGLQHRWLSRDASAKLNTFARDHGLTINNIIQGAWALLLGLHSGENDIVFGATRACRKGTITGADDMVGLFINTVPVRVRINPDMPLVAWLAELRESWRSIFAVEHTPLRLIQRWSEVEASAPLFNSQIVFENQPLEETMHLLDPALRGRGFQLYGGTNFPLTGLLYGGERFSLEIENDRSVIDDATAIRLIDQLATLLDSMAANSAGKVGDLSALPANERALVVQEWNDTTVLFDKNATLVSLMAAQTNASPQAVAVRDSTHTLTYAQLDAHATRLAHRLVEMGVGRNVLVAVCAERSVEMVVALVAILKAGGAYVPLDAEYPAERLAFMLEDAGAPVLLAQRRVAHALPPHRAATVWLDDVLLPDSPEPPIVAQLKPPRPDDLAYMIYTSGSTGRPKGALNAHRGIANRLLWMQSEYRLTNRDVVLQKTPFSFDVSVWEFFWPLMTGAPLIMARPGGHRDTAYLAQTMQTHGVTVCHFVPSMLRAFLADAAARSCTTLRDVMASGEALAPDLVAMFARVLPAAQLHNLYGPTECAVDVSYWPCPRNANALAVVPIGRPVANTQLYVLDERQKLLPIGAPGELYLGGVQVGRGYHNRPELTAERFVTDPFSAAPEARLYRTGDRARWCADGTVEYLGRLDFQVKIRGFRIELGEIESALMLHTAIRDVVVVAVGDGDDKRLAAYLVAHADAPSVGALREHLLESLPDYMVPAIFVWLPVLPLSSNGKVDRRALPAPEVERQLLSRSFVAPRSEIERVLAEIWQKVLRLEQVGVDDNFYELGGDSLLGVQILAVAAQLGVRVSLTQLLRNPTIALLAAVAQVAPNAIAYGEVLGNVALTPVQQWFFETQPETANYWNQAFVFRTDAHLNVPVLAQALAAVIAHHDSLRLRFAHDGTSWTQQVEAASALPEIMVANIAGVEEPLRSARFAEACQQVQSSLNIGSGPLIRVGVLQFGAGEPTRVIVAVHHLAVDGVSWRILREDLETAYWQMLRGERAVLPAKSTPFSSWAQHFAEPAVRASLRADLPYWERVGASSPQRIPRDFPGSGNGAASSTDTAIVRLGEHETRALFQLVPAAYRTQINDVLLAALAETLSRWLDSGDLAINVEGHGREDVLPHADVSRTCGWFTTIFPVRLALGSMPLRDRIRSVKELLRAAPRRGLSYGVLRYFDAAPTLRMQPTPEIVFNYLGQFDQVVGNSTLFKFAKEDSGPWYGAATQRPHLLEVNALTADGCLEVRWSYSVHAHHRDTITALANSFADDLRAIVAHCTTPGIGGYTPSDFPLARLDQRAVDALAAAYPDVEDVYPVTPLQELFLGASNTSTDPGFEQWRFRLVGHLDVAALRAAWQLETERHAILRTAFVTEGLPAAMQVVRAGTALAWVEFDWRALGADEQALQLAQQLATDRATGFVLDRAPLMRITLVRLGDAEYELVWSNHHLLIDRWSWPLILLEIEQAYVALCAGAQPNLPKATRYADFVAWQQGHSEAVAQEFWTRHFAAFDAPPRIAMIRPDASDAETAEAIATLGAADTARLHAFARSHQLAVNSVIEGAWALCLAHRAGHSDISLGVAVSGRDAAVAGIDRLVGLTMNNLPLRVRVHGDERTSHWLAEVHAAQAEMQQFAYVRLSQVQGWSGVPWRTRLFETLLVFQHDDAENRTGAWLGANVATSLLHVPTRTAYPLTVIVAGRDALEFRITFDARFFSEQTAVQLSESLCLALRALMDNADAPVATVLAVLPELSTSRAAQEAADFTAPRNATESVLARIWSEVLGVERVGAHDNFFMLGGYSLVATQIVSRVRTTLKLEAPARLLFQHPTVSELAVVLAMREQKPGQLERIAQVVERVQSLSLDELRRATGAAAANT